MISTGSGKNDRGILLGPDLDQRLNRNGVDYAVYIDTWNLWPRIGARRQALDKGEDQKQAQHMTHRSSTFTQSPALGLPNQTRISDSDV